MTTPAAFLAAIQAAPDDDLPRLVYADWLEENGNKVRADQIRLWCRPESRELVVELDPESRKGTRWEAGLSDIPASVVMVWSRGFVHEVRCTLADWVGGECVGCDGRGYLRVGVGGRKHETCHGTGRTGGIGPRLVREHPIRKVTLTDRRPDEHGGEYWWWAENEYDIAARANQLHGAVFDLLPGEIEFVDSDMLIPFMRFPSEAKAVGAAGAALIAWAKQQPVEPAPQV